MDESMKKPSAYCFEVTSSTESLGFLTVPSEGHIPLSLYFSINSDAFLKHASNDFIVEADAIVAGNILANLHENQLLLCTTMIRFHDPSTGVQIVQVNWLNGKRESVKAYFELRYDGQDMIIYRANSFESIGADANAEIARANHRKAQLLEVIPYPEKSASPDQAQPPRRVDLRRT
jgi:hypothetical protein